MSGPTEPSEARGDTAAERWPLSSHFAGVSDCSAANAPEAADGREAGGAREAADAREVRTLEGRSGGPGALARSVARRKKVGSELPAVECRLSDRRVDPAKLAEYQKLCGFRVSSLLPSTFIHVQTFPLSMAVMGAADFPFPLLGLVHVNNRIVQVRPIDSAETFDLRVWADRLREHPAGQVVDIEAEASVGGVTVWHGTSTYLHRSGPAPARANRPTTPDAPPPAAHWNLSADLGRRYAGVSGDRNPIHLSRMSAKAFGFPRAIAHGMWMNARILGALEPRLSASYTVDVAFKTPAFLPSRVAFTAEPASDGWALGLRNDSSGKPHLAATVSF